MEKQTDRRPGAYARRRAHFALAFFALLARRQFPVTDWIRTPAEFDYVVEPDVFHDLFGHVPLLFNPVFADYMQAYGEGGLKASRLHACENLARLYWYTVEFGLINTPQGLRAYGAGILSSAGELRYSVTSGEPQRVGFDLERIMRTKYKIDTYQATYFVIDSFEQLFKATAPDFTPIYERVSSQPQIEAGAMVQRVEDTIQGDLRFVIVRRQGEDKGRGWLTQREGNKRGTRPL